MGGDMPCGDHRTGGFAHKEGAHIENATRAARMASTINNVRTKPSPAQDDLLSGRVTKHRYALAFEVLSAGAVTISRRRPLDRRPMR